MRYITTYVSKVCLVVQNHVLLDQLHFAVNYVNEMLDLTVRFYGMRICIYLAVDEGCR